MTNCEIDDKIYKGSVGLSVSTKFTGNNEELIVKESQQADNFFNKVEAEFPKLTTEDLMTKRKKLTLSFIVIRLQIDFGDKTNGIPLEFLKMIQTKTVAHRKKVSEEIINRGVKSL
ncbi:MAG: hypothetical protein ACO1NV_15420 [Leptospira bouyouniensis]